MGIVDVDFDIPEEIGRVRHWFMETLWALTDVPYPNKPRVELVLERPRAKKIAVPHADLIGFEIVVAARRIETTHVPSDWCPQFLIERIELKEAHLGRAMVFRLHALYGETYVWASCAERPPALWEAFEDFLKQVEARYPSAGAACRKCITQQRKRMKEDLKRMFGEASREQHPGSETRGHGDAETRRYHAGAPIAQGDAAALKRRRGRKRADPREINKICAQWYKVQDRVTQIDFCNGKGISVSSLRRWLKRYPYPESASGE